jgi:DNA-binding NtrC family response regulator
MPPLRQRPLDIQPLAQHFLHRFNQEHGRSVEAFTDGAVAALIQAPWPGNVRQLENAVERAVVLCHATAIDRNDLPATMTEPSGAVGMPASAPNVGPPLPLKEALVEPEKRIIEQALTFCDGNRERAATLLAINRSTLFHKLKKLGIR